LALSGKTGQARAVTRSDERSRAAARRRGEQQKENFSQQRLPAYVARGVPPNAVGPYSSTAPAGNYRPDRELDVHELLKQQAFASSAASCDDHFEKNRPCPTAVYGVSDQYMVLDSFEKVEGSRTDKGEFQFNFMVQGPTRDQNIGVKDTLDTIIGIQACEFCVPLLPFDEFTVPGLERLFPGMPAGTLIANGALPTDGDATTNPQSQTPFCSKVTMYLKEIGLQSYSDADNRRHHFEFDADVVGAAPAPADGDRLQLTPLKNCEYYLFTEPIQDIHGLTVCFYNPGNPLKFPPDVLYGVTAFGDPNLLVFRYVDQTNLINLAPDDRIFITGFNSANGLLNTYVNRAEGHIIGAGGFAITPPVTSTDPTTVEFRLNPDVNASLFTPNPIGPAPDFIISSSTQIDIKIAKNRVRIPLRFRRIVGRLTNYVSP
jgi:hypothetical protein